MIDEAHRAVTQMYDVLLDRAEQLVGPDLFPICGLTATPGRSGVDTASETQRLVGRFDAHLLTPDLGPEYRDDPLRYFREHGYLATPVHRPLQGREYELTSEESRDLELEGDFPAAFRQRLADDTDRNRLIINTLLEIEPGTPTLVYACTVEHAYLLAMILRKLGRSAAAVSGDTPLTLRRGFIEQFKDGTVQFLVNYGVLTTGFDAPKTECIVLCRPTQSPVLYEQIIGRGLRGPRFGGTRRHGGWGRDCRLIAEATRRGSSRPSWRCGTMRGRFCGGQGDLGANPFQSRSRPRLLEGNIVKVPDCQ